MNIQVFSKSKNRKKIIENAAKFYAKELNLDFSSYKVLIYTRYNLRKVFDAKGLCGKTNDREITVEIDSRLSPTNTLTTLAHEMVHVKQIARGQYRSLPSRNGKCKRFWLGKQVAVSYLKRPWEHEAYRMENVLVEKLLSNLAQNIQLSLTTNQV